MENFYSPIQDDRTIFAQLYMTFESSIMNIASRYKILEFTHKRKERAWRLLDMPMRMDSSYLSSWLPWSAEGFM